MSKWLVCGVSWFKVEGEHSVLSVHPVVECACSEKESIQNNKYYAK